MVRSVRTRHSISVVNRYRDGTEGWIPEAGLAMTTDELRAALVAHHIRADVYDLSGNPGNEVYVLRNDGSVWSVFYSERGHERGTRFVTTESEACSYLLDLLLSDPTTKSGGHR